MKDNAINATTGAVEKYFVKLFINFIENNNFCARTCGAGPRDASSLIYSYKFWRSPQRLGQRSGRFPISRFGLELGLRPS